MNKYHIMEYLDPGCSAVMGYACLEKKEFTKWKKHPHKGEVAAFAIIGGMESMAEWGKIGCKRLWDYNATTDTLPRGISNLHDWEVNIRQCIGDDDETHHKG